MKGPTLSASLKNLAARAVLVLWLVSTAAVAASQPSVRLIRGEGVSPDVEQACRSVLDEQGPELFERVWPFAVGRPTIEVHLLTSAAFEDSLGGSIADWGVGAARGRQAWIDCERARGVGRTTTHVMMHEIAHCLLHQGLGRTPTPAWFHEGVAQVVSGEWRFRDTISLVLNGHLPDLQGLEARFPANAQWADTAYRTSLLAVQTMLDWYGEEVVGDIVLAARRRGDFRLGFLDATGEDYDSFTSRFAGSMRLRFGWLITITRWPTLFVLMGLAFAIGAIFRRRRTMRRMAELEDGDWPESPLPIDAADEDEGGTVH